MMSSRCSFATRSRLAGLAVAIATAWVAVPSLVLAQERPGRFTMSPVDGGFVRLDTESGAMALCNAQPRDTTNASGQWACQPMGDASADVRKLEAENKDLRAEIKRMEDLLGLNGDKPKGDEKHAEQRPGAGSGPFNLPSEQEVDKALGYMERMMKKFHDTMKRLEGATAKGEGSKGI